MRYTNCPAVEDYNDFAEALEDIWQQDGMLLTYAAVLEAERPDTLRGACELLRNLDNYQRVTEGAYGYGQQRLQETLGLDDEAIYELDGYMDFEKVSSGITSSYTSFPDVNLTLLQFVLFTINAYPSPH